MDDMWRLRHCSYEYNINHPFDFTALQWCCDRSKDINILNILVLVQSQKCYLKNMSQSGLETSRCWTSYTYEHVYRVTTLQFPDDWTDELESLIVLTDGESMIPESTRWTISNGLSWTSVRVKFCDIKSMRGYKHVSSCGTLHASGNVSRVQSCWGLSNWTSISLSIQTEDRNNYRSIASDFIIMMRSCNESPYTSHYWTPGIDIHVSYWFAHLFRSSQIPLRNIGWKEGSAMNSSP